MQAAKLGARPIVVRALNVKLFSEVAARCITDNCALRDRKTPGGGKSFETPIAVERFSEKESCKRAVSTALTTAASAQQRFWRG